MGGATSGPRRTRRRWSEEEKQAIVAESSFPGKSIAAVAKQHKLNANQLQGWRRQYSSSNVSLPMSASAFLAVDVAKEVSVEQPVEGAPEGRRQSGWRQGIIEIDLPCGERLHCDQYVDRRALALVIDVLMVRA